MGETWFEALNGLERRALAARGTTRTRALAELGLVKQTVSGWLKDTVAPGFDSVWPLIELYLAWAGEPNGPDAQSGWATLHEAARERRLAADDSGAWAALVRESALWQRVESPGRLREQAAALAAELARRCREAGRDPWWDERLPHRFLRQTETLVGCLRLEHLDAAEAALLALLPLLYCAHQAHTAGRLAPDVHPDDLREEAGEGPERAAFRTFLAGHPWLVRRALQGELPGRTSAGREIGWWLFRRWLAERHTATGPQLAALLAEAGADLADVLEPSLLAELLRLLRRGPGRLAAEDLSELPVKKWLGPAGRDAPARARLIGLTLVAARALALEIPDLPMVLVEHLGVPYAVDLDTLRAALDGARWTRYGDEDPPRGWALRIDCADPATLQAMREHVDHVDAVLRAVHRLSGGPGLEALAALPTHASAHLVAPASGGDGTRRFSDLTTRFTVDERRLRELLMGSQLYGSPALAIRELYQNALDACRYRQARIRHRFVSQGLPVPADAYRGEIRFTQGVDEQGRAYLECRDNGVGMGEQQLAGVFSRAGVSFTGTEEYVEERAEWERFGVEMFPNSRFGIGVLSYFMLADEIRVTSCRMHRDPGDAGRVLQASIAGPGHLFHVEYPAGAPQLPGTAVRLYLRPGALTESSVLVLQRLVGLCEFELTAEDADRLRPRRHRWGPGELQAGSGRPEADSLKVGGATVHGPVGRHGQVIWCGQGGGVLVDGIVTQPPPKRSALGTDGPAGRAEHPGVVVDLRGPEPVPLSVDRSRIVADVTERLDAVVRSGAAALVADPAGPLSYGWLRSLARGEIRYADAVTLEAIRQRVRLPLESRVVEFERAGFLPADYVLLVNGARSRPRLEGAPPGRDDELVPDHVLLWRMLAHNAWDTWPGLADLVPDRNALPPVRPALPSDQRLMTDGGQWLSALRPVPQSAVVAAALEYGRPVSEIAARLTALGLAPAAPDALAELGLPEPQDLELRLNWLPPERPVPLDHLVDVHLRSGMSVREAAERLRRLGFEVAAAEHPPERPDRIGLLLLGLDPDWSHEDEQIDDSGQPLGLLAAACLDQDLTFAEAWRSFAALRGPVDWGRLPERPESGDPVLLSADLGGSTPWLLRSEPVSAVHLLLAAQQLGRSPQSVADRLAEYGFEHIAPVPESAGSLPDRALLGVRLNGRPPWLDLGQPVPASWIALVAQEAGRTGPEVAEELRACGLVVEDGEWHGPTDRREFTLLKAVFDPGGRVEAARLLLAATYIDVPLDEAVLTIERAGWEIRHREALSGHTSVDATLLVGPDLVALTAGSRITYREAVTRASEHEVPVEVVVERLRAYGVEVTGSVAGAVTRKDAVLLSRWSNGDSPWLADGHPIGLVDLLHRAWALDWSVHRVVDRLRELGVEVTEPAALVRAALARVPWADPGVDGVSC